MSIATMISTGQKHISRITPRITLGIALAVSGMSQAMADESDNIRNLFLEPNLEQRIAQALPEGKNVDASFMNPSYTPDLSIAEEARVSVQFVSEGAGYKNSLGYYTFDEGAFDNLSFGDIDSNNNGNVDLSELSAVGGVNSVSMIFNNVSAQGSGGSLLAGDTVVLGGGTASRNDAGEFSYEGGTTFSVGTNVGFFLSANAFNGRGVEGFDQGGYSNVMYTTDFLNPENAGSATIDNAADSSRHVAMLFADENRSEIIMGFEDLHRTNSSKNDWRIRSDEDFNDAVFIVRTDPAEALANNDIAVHAAPAPAAGAGALGILALGALGFTRRRKNAVSRD